MVESLGEVDNGHAIPLIHIYALSQGFPMSSGYRHFQPCAQQPNRIFYHIFMALGGPSASLGHGLAHSEVLNLHAALHEAPSHIVNHVGEGRGKLYHPT